MIYKTETGWKVVDRAKIPDGYEAWCWRVCGTPVEEVEILESIEETTFPTHVLDWPRRHLRPLPCRHDDGSVWIRKIDP